MPRLCKGHELRPITPLPGTIKLNKSRESLHVKLRKSVENYGKVGNSNVLKASRKSLVKSSLGFIKESNCKKTCTKLNSKLGGQKAKSTSKLGYKRDTKSSNNKKHPRTSLILSTDITKEYFFPSYNVGSKDC